MAAKKMDLAIVLGAKPKGAPMGDDEAAPKGGNADEAAQTVIDAIKSNDASALTKALKAFMNLADSDGDEV